MRYIYKSVDKLLTLKIEVKDLSYNKHLLSVTSINTVFSSDENFFREYLLPVDDSDDYFITLGFNAGDYIWAEGYDEENPRDAGMHIWIDVNPGKREKNLNAFIVCIDDHLYNVIKQSFKPLFNNKQIEII